jgi:hypothetical protein
MWPSSHVRRNVWLRDSAAASRGVRASPQQAGPELRSWFAQEREAPVGGAATSCRKRQLRPAGAGRLCSRHLVGTAGFEPATP